MSEQELAASYPAAPAPVAGEPTPEQKAAAAVAAYLNPKETKTDAPSTSASDSPVADRPADDPADAAAAPVVDAIEDYILEAPADLPPSLLSEENEEIFAGFNLAAIDCGIPQAAAESLVEAYVDVQTVLGYGAPSAFSTGEEYTPADAERALRRIWGTDYDAKLGAVRKTVRGLGTKFDDWLSATGMGNSPSTIIALSMFPDTKLSKAQATDELNKLTADKRYLAGDRLLVARAKLLGRIAYS